MSAKRIEKSLCILVSFCMILSTVYTGNAYAKKTAKTDTELAAEEFTTRCDQAGLPLNVSQEVLVNAFKRDPKLLGKCGDALSVIDIINKTRKGEYKEAAIAAATSGGAKYLASIAPAFAAKLSLATTAVQVYTTGVSFAYTEYWVPELDNNMYKLYKKTRDDGLLPEDGLADVQDMASKQRGFWTVFTEAKKRVEEVAKADGTELTPEKINDMALEAMKDAFETRYQKELFEEAQKAANSAEISSNLGEVVRGLENEAANLAYSSQGSQPQSQPPQAPQPEPPDSLPEVPVEPGSAPDDLADEVESSEDTINSLPDLSSDRETDVRNFIAGNVQSYLNMQEMIRQATYPGGVGGAIPSEDGGGESVRVPNLVEFRQMEAQKEIQRQQTAAAIAAMAGIAAAGVSIYQASQARRGTAASSGGSSGCGGANKQQEVEAGTALWWLQQ